MAKVTGLGDNLYVSGYDLSGDVGEVDEISGGPDLLEVTGINKSAVERLGGLRDAHIKFKSFFNTAAGQEHPVLSALPTTDILVSYRQGTTLANPAAALVAKQMDYKGKRDKKGLMVFEVTAEANSYGLEWGKQLTAGKRTDTAATNGTGVDMASGVFSGSSTFGLQAYLHVFAFSGTDVTIKLQESSDDGSGDAYANVTGGAFTTITSSTPTWERIATSTGQTVERYLRVVTTTSGGFTSCQFSVMVVRNDTAPAF